VTYILLCAADYRKLMGSTEPLAIVTMHVLVRPPQAGKAAGGCSSCSRALFVFVAYQLRAIDLHALHTQGRARAVVTLVGISQQHSASY
jgi:hypothetical protein